MLRGTIPIAMLLLMTVISPALVIESPEHVESESYLYPALDISVPAVKAKPNDVYDDVWEGLGYTGAGVNIAVIDTGVDDGHETFAGKWVAGVEIPDPTDPRDGTNNPDDRNGHGTMTAGCAVGLGGDNGTNTGVAPGAGLVEVKVANDLIAGFSTNQYLIDGINWCVDHMHDDWGDEDPTNDGIHVLSISYANQDNDDGSSDLAQAVDNAVDHGLVVVVAIGNDGPNNDGFGAPGSADKAITVGGIDDQNTVHRDDDEIWDSSTRGPRRDDGDDNPHDELKPEVVAPAVDIFSATHSVSDQDGSGWNSADGTSYAAPHVSGIAALMLEANPDLTQEDIDYILRETAEARGQPMDANLSEKYNGDYGYGIVDAYAAVYMAKYGFTPGDDGLVCVIDEPMEGAVVSGVITIRGTAWSSGENITSVQTALDGGSWYLAEGTDEWTATWDTTEFENGNYTIMARAHTEDAASEIYMRTVTVYNEGGGPSGNGGGDDDDDGLPGFMPMTIVLAFAAVLLARRPT